jgi:Niemann-Pick C1 protein
MRVASIASCFAAAILLPPVFAELLTPRHEEGRCAIRGHCGKTGFFGRELPCPDNGKAREADPALREKLVDLCGKKWQDTPVCCEEVQVDALKKNLELAQGIIASCPACKENFFNLFCTFTCSPDQSLFVNITKTAKSTSGKTVVKELDNIWSPQYQSGFYESCKNVKNGASGGKAIDFIGGGAKNYTQFLKFLGDEKLFGSPFQIDFLTEARNDGPMKPAVSSARACNDTDKAYRCTCIDCPQTCAELEEVLDQQYCKVGKLPCLSFAVIIIYSVGLLLLMTAVSGHVAYRQHQQRKSERLQLLQDAAPSDDEDEGDVVHNAGMLDRPQRNYYLNQIFHRAFSRLGGFCARYPALTIGTNVLVVALLSLGCLKFEVERDPVRLWVSPTSAAAEEKAFFDENFGPFFRAEQAFLVNDTSSEGPSPVLSYETLQWWFDIEAQISRMKSREYGLALHNVCFKPTGNACVVQSVSAYFNNGLSPDTWQETLEECADAPGGQNCLPEFKAPVRPDLVLGGFAGTENVTKAEAIVVTWVVNNHPQGSQAELEAQDWEESFISHMLAVQDQARERGLRLSFNTERSLEEELNKSSNTDAKIVAISYVVMFIYASLALGTGTITFRSLLNKPSTALVQSKFTLGVVGILIVLMSVLASVGFFSAVGIKVTLIIAAVIPFLVLAVGVDNIFLIVHEFERVNLSHPDEEIDERVAKALGRMGPSILLSASTETVAFAMGAFVGMPAVKNFAAYAAGAVFVNAMLQVTMFVSVLALNQRRVESLRADCFPCISIPKASSGVYGGQFSGSNEEGPLQRFIRKTYAPTLLNKQVKTVVVAFFVTLFAIGIALIPEVELGLDQRYAVPSDSYLIQYFNDLYDYFGTGPPVYFVTRGLNATARVHQQQICGAFSTCDEYSLEYILAQESKRPKVSYIGETTASWIDDFFYWLNPTTDCCKEDDGQPCFEGRDPPWNITLYGMPEGEEFIHYITKWIHAPTNENCPNGGQAAYSNAVVVDKNHTTIPASHFRTSHTPLRSQHDFIASYAAARRISDSISKTHDIDVFPYSKFYIFFDQYASIVRLTATLVGSAIAIIFLLSSLLLGSLFTGLVVSLTVIMIVVDIIGVMAIFHVSLNAISLVNLVICVGIGVEFCAHIARAFMFPSKSVMEKARNKFRGRDARAWTALVNVGGSVFSGITITKLLGVCVLAFTRSKIFEIYYFRIWLALVILAATHALVFLPVALSFAGGDGEPFSSYHGEKFSLTIMIGYIDPESEGGLEEDLAGRRYRALLPQDDYDSEDD